VGTPLIYSKSVRALSEAAVQFKPRNETEAVLDRRLQGTAAEEMQISVILYRINNLSELLIGKKTTKAHKLVSALLGVLLEQTPDEIYIDCSEYNEFLVVMPGIPQNNALQAGNEICDRFAAVVKEVLKHDKTEVFLSGGVANFPHHAESRPELFRVMRDSLRKAKNQGNATVYPPETTQTQNLDIAISEHQYLCLKSIADEEDVPLQDLIQQAVDQLLCQYELT